MQGLFNETALYNPSDIIMSNLAFSAKENGNSKKRPIFPSGSGWVPWLIAMQWKENIKDYRSLSANGRDGGEVVIIVFRNK